MDAIIQTGGKQYQVTKGQKITVEKLDAEIGTEVQLDTVALVSDKFDAGSKAKVSAKVIGHTKGKKLIASTYKRRKGYHKTHGHRQQLTNIEITDIQA